MVEDTDHVTIRPITIQRRAREDTRSIISSPIPRPVEQQGPTGHHYQSSEIRHSDIYLIDHIWLQSCRVVPCTTIRHFSEGGSAFLTLSLL